MIILFLLYVVSAVKVPFPNAPNGFTMDYILTGKLLSVELTLAGYDTSSWIKGQSGLWMGLAYNSNSMKDVVYSMCTYEYNDSV